MHYFHITMMELSSSILFSRLEADIPAATQIWSVLCSPVIMDTSLVSRTEVSPSLAAELVQTGYL